MQKHPIAICCLDLIVINRGDVKEVDKHPQPLPHVNNIILLSPGQWVAHQIAPM